MTSAVKVPSTLFRIVVLKVFRPRAHFILFLHLAEPTPVENHWYAASATAVILDQALLLSQLGESILGTSVSGRCVWD